MQYTQKDDQLLFESLPTEANYNNVRQHTDCKWTFGQTSFRQDRHVEVQSKEWN